MVRGTSNLYQNCGAAKVTFILEGYQTCMERKPHPKTREIEADEDFEAHLVAIGCSKAPTKGYTR